jgi:hypothetical protein
VVIGCGKEPHIEEFREVTGYQGKILTDPSRESFQILGFPSSIGGLLGMKTISRGLAAFRQGIKPGSLQGSPLQLGGAVVVDTDSSIRYLYRSSEAGDDPPVKEMLEALP